MQIIETSSAAAQRLLRKADADPVYEVTLATGIEQLRAAQALRYAVFNLELNEGLASAHATGLDADKFDLVCDHLIVTEKQTGEVVGTYRLQTGRNAALNFGYYSEQEFDFAPYETIRDEMIELGRACVHKAHRNMSVLSMLWGGIARYARERGGRYLVGCSSLTSQDAAEGAAVYRQFENRYLAPETLRTLPLPEVACPLDIVSQNPAKPPKLLSTYLSLGSKIAGPPAIDHEFGTIDFLTLFDIHDLSARSRMMLGL
ncbi:MAG: GNAT family N-acetyltransferase [Hydrogenophilaceae bacterium]|nr:GNAT family N-acetyltransferase [Hydrogenophilaceae bacterium]